MRALCILIAITLSGCVSTDTRAARNAFGNSSPPQESTLSAPRVATVSDRCRSLWPRYRAALASAYESIDEVQSPEDWKLDHIRFTATCRKKGPNDPGLQAMLKHE